MNPTQFFKCLADETRLKSLLLIESEQEMCVCELMEALGVGSQPKISRHLALLKQQGVLLDRKHQQWVFYRINPALPDWCREIIATTLDNNLAFIKQSLNSLNKMGERPERIANCCD